MSLSLAAVKHHGGSAPNCGSGCGFHSLFYLVILWFDRCPQTGTFI
jgi:hypothetical protein